MDELIKALNLIKETCKAQEKCEGYSNRTNSKSINLKDVIKCNTHIQELKHI